MASGDPIEYITPARIIEEINSVSPIVVYQMLFETVAEGAEYVMLFDTNALPPPAAPPEVTIKLFGNGYASYVPAKGYRLFQTGLAVGLSTTGDNYNAETVPYLIYMLEGREP